MHTDILPVATNGRLRLCDAVRLITEHEAALATDTPKFEVHWDREWPLLRKMLASARSGDLNLYERGTFQSIAPDKLPTTDTLLMTREAYPPDLDAWLDLHEPHTPFRFRLTEQAKPANADTPAAEPGARVAWRVAAEKQLPALLAAHERKYPGHKAALRWLKDNDSEGAFVRDDKDDEFTWVMANSKRSKPTSLKTFMNGMLEILERQQIPD
ncbi:hypothetical protein [Paraburkholderia sp. DGU8]|uniref:hypothetical protein n=1 Tax=Paraburkholderia sp. DGU8 TaxID=3161997 RepID=UPI00346608FB